MIDKLEITFNDHLYTSEDSESPEAYLDEKKRLDHKVRELFPESKIEVIETNLGFGADWPTFTAVITGLYFLGKPILENLDAWVELGNRVRKLFDSDEAPARTDKHGNIALIINHLQKASPHLLEKSQSLHFEHIYGESPLLTTQCAIEDHPEIMTICIVYKSNTGQIIQAKNNGRLTVVYEIPSLLHFEF